MSLVVELRPPDVPGQISGWERLFRFLSLERLQPLLHDLGLPASMAGAPQALWQAARFYWESWEHGKPGLLPIHDRESAQRYKRAAERLLNQAFALLEEAYGEEAARQFYEWGRRTVSHEEDRRWFAWSLLLTHLDTYDPIDRRRVPPLLSAGTLERICAVVHERLGPSVRVRDEERLARIVAEPRTPDDLRALLYKDPWKEELQEMNFRDWLNVRLGQQYAYEIWAELDSWLTDEEREALIEWGRAEAEAKGYIPRVGIDFSAHERRPEQEGHSGA